MNQIQTYTEKIKREVEAEYGMGGLSDGLYGDYASEVAKRSLIQTYQELIEWAERYKVLQNKLGEVDENQTEEICCATTETLNAIISYLKGRIEEVKKDVAK